MFIRVSALVATAVFILSCGDKSGGDATNTGQGGADQPATPEALKEMPVNDLELKDVIDALKDIEVRHPESTVSSYYLAKKDYLFCESEEKTVDKVELTGNRVDVTYEANAQSCIAGEMPSHAVLSNERGSAKFKFSMACDAEGLEVITENKASSFFEGSDKAIGGDIVCSSAEGVEGLRFTDVEIDLGVTAAANDKTVSVATYSGYSTAKEDGTPCTYTILADSKIDYSDCVYQNYSYTKTDASDDTKDSSEATKLYAKYTGLSARTGGKYYREGMIEVELNNWTGTFQFANASSTPIGTLTNGKDEYKIKLDEDGTAEASEEEIAAWKDPLSFEKDTELNLVSVYEPDSASITVNYNRTANGVLVLSSYDKVDWVISGNTDKIVAVIVSQYDELSSVSGVSEDLVNNIGYASNPSSESHSDVESYTWKMEDLTRLDKTTLIIDYNPSSMDVD